MDSQGAIAVPREVFNIYGDESCHLEHDGQKIMGLGAIICPMSHASEINHQLKMLKVKHGMPKYYFLWTTFLCESDRQHEKMMRRYAKGEKID